jgi:protein-tyrosine phosphatase
MFASQKQMKKLFRFSESPNRSNANDIDETSLPSSFSSPHKKIAAVRGAESVYIESRGVMTTMEIKKHEQQYCKNKKQQYNQQSTKEQDSKILHHKQQQQQQQQCEHHNVFGSYPSDEYVMKHSYMYQGPSKDSNWVLPGRLLVGAYPHAPIDTSVSTDVNTENTNGGCTIHDFDVLSSILKKGITTFVCLAREYPIDIVDSSSSNSSSSRRPRAYFDVVRQIISDENYVKKLKFDMKNESFSNHVNNIDSHLDIVTEDNVTFVHYPIVDHKCTEDNYVIKLAYNLIKALERGEIIYLHCMDGSGRTGIMVSLLLHLIYGIDAQEAMSRCQLLYDIREGSKTTTTTATAAGTNSKEKDKQRTEKKRDEYNNSSSCDDSRCNIKSITLSPQTVLQRIQVQRIVENYSRSNQDEI